MTCIDCHRLVRLVSAGRCSMCHRRWKRFHAPPNATCRHCGRAYFDQESNSKKQTLCSRKCLHAWRIGRDPRNELIADRPHPVVDEAGKVVLECEHCGRPFRVSPYEIAKRMPRFCSLQCNGARKAVSRALLECEYCREVFRIRPKELLRIPGRFCSRGCYEQARRENRLPREARRSEAYESFRQDHVSRVGRCARCGSSERLRLHHRVRSRERPDLLFDLDNVEVLCSACHMRIHRRLGHLNVPGQAS